MRQVRYSVAMSLDGYIAGPNGEYDWIIIDPEIDFQALYARYDAILVGRKSLMPMLESGEEEEIMPGMKTYVFSTTLEPQDYPHFTVVSENVKVFVEALKRDQGKDIWLFGGGELFRSLNKLGLVDGVDVAIIPILLGEGIPFLPSTENPTTLELSANRVYSSGTVSLEYNTRK
ncbi:MAG: dihydrofolate reductase family protein [Proteobacteria bacterium]|nr:dihydrofolate reductase family protein [Pseudomonadota bacterium]